MDINEKIMAQDQIHKPVMAKEVVEYLSINPQACIVDCTVGLGQHAAAIAQGLQEGGCIVGIDRDGHALSIAQNELQGRLIKTHYIHGDYRNIDRILESLGIVEVDGILLDLGISSYQLDNPDRGFSFNSEGPLDMRMDQESYISAYDLVNSLSEKEISSILKNFGEERWHNRIAHLLVEERAKNPINSTQDLKEIVVRAIPSQFRHQKIHAATKTFQAFRIAVNRELEALEIALAKSVSLLKIGGRICVISFHSLEDRIVKQSFRYFEKQGFFSILTKKPLTPTEEEIRSNPRSRSAKLRVAERIK